MHKYYN